MAERLYCKYCGKKLVINNRITGYDEFTGKPIQPYLDQRVCPSGSMYRDCEQE